MQNNIKRIKILDSSLREGEQMRGFRLSLDEKIALIRLLKDFGIRFIEIGHPAISEEDESLCKTICNTISVIGLQICISIWLSTYWLTYPSIIITKSRINSIIIWTLSYTCLS